MYTKARDPGNMWNNTNNHHIHVGKGWEWAIPMATFYLIYFMTLKLRPWRPTWGDWEVWISSILRTGNPFPRVAQKVRGRAMEQKTALNLLGTSFNNWVLLQSLISEAKPASPSFFNWEGRIFIWIKVLSEISVMGIVKASLKTPLLKVLLNENIRVQNGS